VNGRWRKGRFITPSIGTIDFHPPIRGSRSRASDYHSLLQRVTAMRTGSYAPHDCTTVPGWHLPAVALRRLLAAGESSWRRNTKFVAKQLCSAIALTQVLQRWR
jgi:hypothetical protein